MNIPTTFLFNAKRFVSKNLRFETVVMFRCDCSQQKTILETNIWGYEISNIKILGRMKCLKISTS